METNTHTTHEHRPDAWRELSDLPDDRLAELARHRNLAAFETLMRRHNRRLFRVTRSVLPNQEAAEEAVREAFLAAFAQLDAGEHVGRCGAWLSRIALGEALSMRQRARAERDPGDSPSVERYAEAAHARALLERAIDGLPEHFRMVLVMRVVEGLDVKETAESLQLHTTTVRTRLYRAQRRLREELTRRLREESADLYEFTAEQGDRVVERVLARLTA